MGVHNKCSGKRPEARGFLVHPKGGSRREGKRWNLRHMVLLRGVLSLPERLIEN